jgi:glycosyltransferase involved in cell wall biosynthesis
LGTRVQGLLAALAERGHPVHLWFVGDPDAPGHEERGGLHLHRWCQWLSHHKPGGVYDGERDKAADYAASLPPYLMQRTLLPHLLQGGRAVVLAEEWQTANAVLHLDWLLRQARVRSQVTIAWNANNTFGFDDIDWHRLGDAAKITTVSRYMRHRMNEWGIDAIVVPNGLPPDAYQPPDRSAVARLHRQFADRLVITKMARWDPDKRWLASMDIVAAAKQQGWRPLLVARGGTEPHGVQVLEHARNLGLRIADRTAPAGGGIAGLVSTLGDIGSYDVLNLRSHVDPDSRRVLFRASDVVLANSSHEPFGLVGLEAMAVGAIACTGCTGEDYAVPGHNAVVLQTSKPGEFLSQFNGVWRDPSAAARMRRAGKSTARHYAWDEVIDHHLQPWLEDAA